MSRRSRTTITFTLRLPLPAGATTKGAQLFLFAALADRVRKQREALPAGAPNDGMAGLALQEVLIKQTGRETQYL